MRVLFLSAASLLFVVAAAAPPTVSAQSDPRIGTWVLNSAKSKFNGPALQSQTITFAPAADGALKFTTQQVNPDGKHILAEWTAKSDGKDYPVTGHPVGDTVSVKDTDAYTSDFTMKSRGKAVQHLHFEVSGDDRTMTVTVTGATSFSADDKNNNVHVLEKR
jgi:hypothetical protein